MNKNTLLDGLRDLPSGDKLLLKLFFGAALVALALGVVFGAGTAFTRAGFMKLSPNYGYRLMTLHGVTIFFYWLYFVQAGLLLVLSAVYTETGGRIAWRRLAWAGLALMLTGFLLSQYGATSGFPLLYDAPPVLAREHPPGVGSFYLGYLLLGAGLSCVAISSIATALKPRFEGRIADWPVVSFASVAWAGLLMVSAVATVNAFFPAARWSFGFAPLPADYSTGWMILFHNMHYLPLMAAGLVWYVLVEAVSGVKSIFGPRFSKIVFSLYLIFVPPTSLYHMFLQPNLAEPVRVFGSLLSLFIGVPTVLVFLVIVSSLEVHARAYGARGLFGWIRKLPWRNPAMAAMGMAVINLALGGTFSFVLIQERLAPLLSDTFFVPGYFHFLTVGTVTLTFLAALCYVIPGLTGRALWKPGLLTVLPYLATIGLALFGASGIIAGYLGVPRRVLDVSYAGAAPGVWQTLMIGVGAGSALMGLALFIYFYGLFRTLLPGTLQPLPQNGGFPVVDWGDVLPRQERAWVGPLAVVVLVGAMALFTTLAFEMMKTLPLLAAGTGGH
jgi:cytochrome c oxidase subunit 1